MNRTRIYLLGFMGCGKTTTGKVLARKLGWEFADLDDEIQKGEGLSVAEIFRSSGESGFRNLENKYLNLLSVPTHRVVALGGGTFVNEENRNLTRATGFTVWLKVPFDKVVQRVRIDGTRPLFTAREQAEALYDAREALYCHAGIHISTDDKSPEALADEIIEAIKTA